MIILVIDIILEGALSERPLFFIFDKLFRKLAHVQYFSYLCTLICVVVQIGKREYQF